MKVDNIKEFYMFKSSYKDIEDKLFKAKKELLFEAEYICFEVLKDLKEELTTPDKLLMNKINESFTIVNNYRRNKNNDVDMFIGLIDELITETATHSNDLILTDEFYSDFIPSLNLISTSITESFNHEIESFKNGNMYTLSENNLNEINHILYEGVVEFLEKIKSGFGNKHDKILERDGEWLKKNKKKLLDLDFKEIEIEVPSDNKVSFANLINRHDTFDKNFKDMNGSYDDFYENIRRFEDKNENLKNGLDNYIRNGNSRREISMKKLSGDEAKAAVENMVNYCEEFLSGKGYIESKLTNIIADCEEHGKEEVKESLLFDVSFDELNKFTLEYIKEAVEDDEDIDALEKDITGEDDEEPADEEEPVEDKKETSDLDDKAKILRDRQTGITVLMTIAEERYFDYIDLLKGLIEEE